MTISIQVLLKEEKKYVFILCEVYTVSVEKIFQLSGKQKELIVLTF